MAAGCTLLARTGRTFFAVYAAKSTPADQCSTGEEEGAADQFDSGQRPRLAADLGRAPILLLDEVAAHLDAARRAALYDEICAPRRP